MAYDEEKRRKVDEPSSFTKFGRPDEKDTQNSNQGENITPNDGMNGGSGNGSLYNGISTDTRRGAAGSFGTQTPQQAGRTIPGNDVRQTDEYMAQGIGAMGTNDAASGTGTHEAKIGPEQLAKARQELMRYKAGKASLDERIIASEQWWKMRHWEWMKVQGNRMDTHYTSAWLFNCIINRHADAISSYPQPNILPREPQDKETARILSAIVPCIMEANDFEEVYSEVMWQKLKQGTGCYGIFWDKSKLGGLGDISIRRVELLNLFWEPGIRNIQESRNLFHVELVDNDLLKQQYPELEDKLNGGNDVYVNKYIYDDNVDTTNKSAVIDWYYHTYDGPRKTLQYCKFVGDTVIYASEDDYEQPMEEMQQQIGTNMMTGQPEMTTQRIPMGNPIAEEGWYAHGEYPFVFDTLFPIEGSPAGFGYVDVCKSSQEQIDRLNKAIIDNAIVNSTPRYFVREDGGINETEFADFTKPFVHVNSNLGEDTIRAIEGSTIHSNYITIMNNKITELKETSNNTDSSNGITSGVTAASGIAAQQEAAGKVSRASTMSAYRAYNRVVHQVVELIRQFYDIPRQFRIAGQANGNDQFVSFDNSQMQPQSQGIDFGQEMGFRKPVFDIKVSAQSKTVYTQNSQNELVLSLANMGIFNPQMVDQSLMILDAMDFDGKEEIMRKVSEAGTMQQMFAQVSQIALELANRYDPAIAQQLANIIMQRQGVSAGVSGAVNPNAVQQESNTTAIDAGGGNNGKEVAQVRNARERAANAGNVAR